MHNAKRLAGTYLACAILSFALPNFALGQCYETNYEEQYRQPAEKSPDENTENKDKSGGLPWWVWAIIIWIGLGWLADSDNGNHSTRSQPHRTQPRRATRTSTPSNPYVIDPSR